ncbi:MAG TPA: hypothetical protein VI197_14885 [Polyangiaceae bacterium]
MTITRFLCSLLLTVSLCACGSSDRPDSSEAGGGNPLPPGGTGSSSEIPPTDDVETGTCDRGDSRDCRVWLPEVNGVKNCFVGTQVCADELWSSCLSDDDAAALLDG